MFLADMHCYGRDPRFAGVTGISGCMGVVLSYSSGYLYAVHVPPNAREVLQRGRATFVNYVKGKEQPYVGSNAELITLVNGTNRKGGDPSVGSDAWGEAQMYARALRVRKLTEVRITGHIPTGKNSASHEYSVVVVLRRSAELNPLEPFTVFYRKANSVNLGLAERVGTEPGELGGSYHGGVEYKTNKVVKTSDVILWSRAIPNVTATFKTCKFLW